MPNRTLISLALSLAAFALVPVAGCGRGGSLSSGSSVAPTPPAFDASITLASANETAQQSGKPVLVFATADWCPPCQELKRNALASEQVTKLIKERTVPVLLDVSREVPAGAEALNIQGIPALIVRKNGREVSRLVGDVPEGELVAWLEASTK